MAELRIDDFSGGKTDHYVNGPVNRAREYDNLLITRNKKPIQRPGSVIYDEANPQIPQGIQRVSQIKEFEGTLFATSERNLNYIDGAFNQLLGPVDTNPAFGAGTVNSHITLKEWQGHLFGAIDEYSTPRKIYKDQLGNWQVRNAGLPALASAPTFTPTGSGNSYVYALHYSYTYQVGTVEYKDVGPVFFSDAVDTNVIDGANPVNLTNIPVISNSTTEAWDTLTIKCEIYRTAVGGTVFQYVGEVTNGTTIFADTVTDANLGTTIYTTGGVISNDPAPPCKYVVIANDIGWYLNVKEGTEEKSFRIRHSLPFQPEGSPESYFVDVEGEITGGSNIDIYPIIFTKDKTIRLEGTVDELGRGFVKKRIVSDRIGCISNDSIVRTVRGVYFVALDGFYFTDGFRVQKLSNHLIETYTRGTVNETQQKRINGAYDDQTGRIYWSFQSDPNGTDCDTIFVLDTYWPVVEPGEASFTTYSGDEDIMRPTAVEIVNGELIRGDRQGYIFIHQDNLTTDPVIDTGDFVANWDTRAVIYTLESCAFSMGTESQTKYGTKVYAIYKNLSNLSTEIRSINNDSGQERALKDIRFRSNVEWGQEDIVWGDEDVIWNFGGLIITTRRFPARGLRFIYKQIVFTNAFTIIGNSDVFGEGDVDASALTVTMSDTVANNWPSSILGFQIFFEDDDYELGYEITNRTDDVLTVLDPDGQLVTGTNKRWVIRGFRKTERFSLESYTIYFDPYGDSIAAYSMGDDGSNA